MSSVEDIKKLRFQYLYAVYKETQDIEGNQKDYVNKYGVGKKINLNRNAVDKLVDYFIAEGLLRDLRWASRSGAHGDTSQIQLTRKGIKELEHQVEKPDLPTEHFPPHSVTFNISGGQFTNSPFQVASKDSSQNITVINQSQSAELKEIVTELKRILSDSKIPDEKKQELEAEVQTIESQSKSPKPKIQIIKDALSSAKGIVEEAGGLAVAAAPLITRITSWLNGVP